MRVCGLSRGLGWRGRGQRGQGRQGAGPTRSGTDRTGSGAKLSGGGANQGVAGRVPCLLVLRQRVADVVVVVLGEQLRLLVGAAQRVAAAVGAHVERGVDRVGEVGRLIWVQSEV